MAEELLRYDSPVKAPVLRFTKAEIRVADTVIPAGEALVLLLSAANRDASRFSSPADLDIGRDTAGHVGFGHGVHFCLGAPLARLEAEIAFTALLTRFPELALSPGPLAWRRSFQLHSLKSLPVTFGPSSAGQSAVSPASRSTSAEVTEGLGKPAGFRSQLGRGDRTRECPLIRVGTGRHGGHRVVTRRPPRSPSGVVASARVVTPSAPLPSSGGQGPPDAAAIQGL